MGTEVTTSPKMQNGVAIKMITILTIKKYMKSPSNYDSYLIFNLEQFFHCHLFVLGDPTGSVHAAKAAAATVLVEEDIIKLDLHEGGAWRQHLIMALSTNSASEGNHREGRKSGSLTKVLYGQTNFLLLCKSLQRTASL